MKEKYYLLDHYFGSDFGRLSHRKCAATETAAVLTDPIKWAFFALTYL